MPLKVAWTVVLRNQGFMLEHEAEVSSLPCDGFVWADKAGGYAGDGALAGLGGAFFVEVNA